VHICDRHGIDELFDHAPRTGWAGHADRFDLSERGSRAHSIRERARAQKRGGCIDTRGRICIRGRGSCREGDREEGEQGQQVTTHADLFANGRTDPLRLVAADELPFGVQSPGSPQEAVISGNAAAPRENSATSPNEVVVGSRIAAALVGTLLAVGVVQTSHAAAYPTFTSAICRRPHPLMPVEYVATQATSVQLEGTADPGAEVAIRLWGSLVANVHADGSGRWSLLANGLPEGFQRFNAYAVDAEGNEDFPDVCVFQVDRTPPDPPVVYMQDGGLTPARVRIEGASEPGFVDVSEAGVHLARVASTGTETGTWRFDGTFADGGHVLDFFTIDRAGNRSLTARTVPIEVDATLPKVAFATKNKQVFLRNAIIEGSASDERNLRVVFLDYVDVTGKVVRTVAPTCPGCPDARESGWSDRPTGLLPGLYTVVATAYDRVDNPSVKASIQIFVV
jgi:hypothetical protein